MKTTTKTVFSLVLALVFMFACFVITVIVFAMAWLHTYRVFTDKRPVAEVTVSALKEDDNGEYVDVTVKQIKAQSPLARIFNPKDVDIEDFEETQTFKIYGDEITLGGPVVRFRDVMTLFNFKTVYKLAVIKGDYTNVEREKGRDNINMPRIYELNGGAESWQDVSDALEKKDLKGRIFEMFIDYGVEIQAAGVFASENNEKTFKLCVSEDGFLICDEDTE
jgi:hypothetical protein